MEKVRVEDYWEELTSHPEILNSISRPMPGWNDRKSYCVAAIPWGQQVAQKIAEIIGQPVLFAESQNLSLSQVEEHVLYLARCRYDDLGRDEVLLLGSKMNEAPFRPLQNRLQRGDFYVSPSGKKFLVTGCKGDPRTTSSMGFRAVTEEEAAEILAEREAKRREEQAAAETAKKAEEEKRELEYLQYRSTIRGLTEGLDLSILSRMNTASTMPAPYMVCRYMTTYEPQKQHSFVVVVSFCSLKGCYAFLRKIVKFVRQTNGGRITSEAWEKLDLDAAIKFALDECNKYAEKKVEAEAE